MVFGYCQAEPDSDELQREFTLLWLANSFMTVLNDAGSFLTMEESEHVRVTGELFLKTWIAQAHAHPALYRVRPKFHILHHCLLEAASRSSRRNVREDSTWMDEDFMKKVARILKKTHRRTTARTSLQRYLVFLRGELDIAVEEG